MAVKAFVDADTIVRGWAQQCADCDRLMAVITRRRKTCSECHSSELVAVYATDCPRCGEMVLDSEMSLHLTDHQEEDNL